MPTLTSESVAELWKIASMESKESPDLIEVRCDRTSPQGSSFLFYRIDGKDENFITLTGEELFKIEGLVVSTREQFFEEKDLYKIPDYPSLYCFCVRKIGSFYVYIKRLCKNNNLHETEEEIFITPYIPVVLEWLKKYNSNNKETLAGLQAEIGDGKRFLPICDELNKAIGETEKLMKIFKS